MHHKQPFHIAFYVDGFTLKKVNTFYRKYHPFHSTLDFLGIKNWARDQALRLFDPPKKYALMDCHYYHPDRDPGSKTTPSHVYIKRCEAYKVNPPVAQGETWDGVFTATEK